MATEINFYHLTRSSLEDALPRLLLKTMQAGERAVVMLGSPERVDALNSHLWTFDPDSFLPHGSVKDGEADRQPVWLTHLDENPNCAVPVRCRSRAIGRGGRIQRCFELFDGRDGSAVGESRQRWKAYKAAGHKVVYWQQAAAAAGKRRPRLVRLFARMPVAAPRRFQALRTSGSALRGDRTQAGRARRPGYTRDRKADVRGLAVPARQAGQGRRRRRTG